MKRWRKTSLTKSRPSCFKQYIYIKATKTSPYDKKQLKYALVDIYYCRLILRLATDGLARINDAELGQANSKRYLFFRPNLSTEHVLLHQFYSQEKELFHRKQ